MYAGSIILGPKSENFCTNKDMALGATELPMIAINARIAIIWREVFRLTL
jgi:hypothetical protein